MFLKVFIAFTLFHLSYSTTIPCNSAVCLASDVNFTQIGNGACNSDCMSANCFFDSLNTAYTFDLTDFDPIDSDCYYTCISNYPGCKDEMMKNGVCDSGKFYIDCNH